jgi:NADH:ubiquinone oxidoreductase subunit 3 (subunit A)
MDFLLSPPVAFLLYLPLAFIFLWLGKKMAPENPSAEKSSVYGSGEIAPDTPAAPGYRPFLIVAFFFAILHLAILVVATGGLTLTTGAYVIGLIFTLVALILG